MLYRAYERPCERSRCYAWIEVPVLADWANSRLEAINACWRMDSSNADI